MSALQSLLAVTGAIDAISSILVNEALGRKKLEPVSMLKCGERLLFKSVEIANSFAQHFRCIPSPTPTSLISTITPAQTVFNFQRISEENVLKKLVTLDERKATGPDKISAKLLKLVAPSIVRSITSLYNYSLLSGRFPSEWKEARVTPVPKSGNKDLISNYRPVSIIPVLAKVFEGLIHHQVYGYLEKNALIKDVQTGVRKDRSTQDILLGTVDDWKTALDQGQDVAAVMIDLSKAFDTVNHDLLTDKLTAYGIRERELRWFKDYLSNRRQRVVVNGAESDMYGVTKGVHRAPYWVHYYSCYS